MEIDLTKFKAELDVLKEEAWEIIKTAKLSEASSEELEIMKNLWSHGFIKGAEASTVLSMTLYDTINKKA